MARIVIPDDFPPQIKGTEVCLDCKQKVDELVKDIYALQATVKKEIREICSEIEKELAKIEKVHTKVEKRLGNIFTGTKLKLEEMVRIVVEGEKKQENDTRT